MLQAPMIDMERTGKRIRQLCTANQYSVRELQDYLRIGCPQSIYNWYHGKTLPSLDHLYALSYLLQVPVNWLVVSDETDYRRKQRMRIDRIPQIRRVKAYRDWFLRLT